MTAHELLEFAVGVLVWLAIFRVAGLIGMVSLLAMFWLGRAGRAFMAGSSAAGPAVVVRRDA